MNADELSKILQRSSPGNRIIYIDANNIAREINHAQILTRYSPEGEHETLVVLES